MAFSEPANQRLTVFVELLWILSGAGVMLYTDVVLGLCTVLAAIFVYGYYGISSYRRFGGITGDLEGYFVELVELVMLVVVAVWCIVQGVGI